MKRGWFRAAKEGAYRVGGYASKTFLAWSIAPLVRKAFIRIAKHSAVMQASLSICLSHNSWSLATRRQYLHDPLRHQNTAESLKAHNTRTSRRELGDATHS
eukprot:2951214-Rhodomonas_salina.2